MKVRARGSLCLSKCIDIHAFVTVKTITLTKEAYDALASQKNEGESFSEVVRRLTGTRLLLSAYAGAWRGAPTEDIARVRRFLRDSDRLSRQKLQRLSRGKQHHG